MPGHHDSWETIARQGLGRLPDYWRATIGEQGSPGGTNAMHKILTSTLALPLLLCAGAAMAEQATGTVDSVDLNARTVVVGGTPYMLENGAAGLKIDEIKVGEKVTVEFDVNTNNVTMIEHAK